MGVENFYIEKASADSASPESMCLDGKSSVIFKSGCFVVKAFAVQRLKFRLYFNITLSSSVAKVSQNSLCHR